MSHLNFLRSQQSNYNVRQPNMFIANDEKDRAITDRNDTNLFGIFGSISETGNTSETRQVNSSPFTKLFNYIVSDSSLKPTRLVSANNDCMSYSNMTGNKSLQGYKSGQYNPQNNNRCGWIYNKQTRTFTGHIGTNGQPIKIIDDIPTNYVSYTRGSNIGSNTLWFWDLDDPNLSMFQDFHKCSMDQCGDVTSLPTCGWDSEQKMGIPLNSNKNRKYATSNDPFNYTPTASGTYINTGRIYTASNADDPKCSGISGGGDTSSANPEKCIINNPSCSDDKLNGISLRNSKQCLREVFLNAGCSNNGTIGLALQGSAGQDYTYGLNNSNSYVRYVRDFSITNSNNNIQNIFGNNASDDTCEKIYTSFNKLYSNAQLYATNKSSKNSAAADLCFTSGTYDDYDFCSEYIDGTINNNYNPFSVECMQREFRQQGGQISGTEYPTANNLPSGYTWARYKGDVTALKNKTYSSNLQEQADAFIEFYGIPMQQFSKQGINRVQGVEVFWFTNDSTPRFLGRRIQSDLTLKTNNLATNNISFISFFNLRSSSPTIKYVAVSITTPNTVSVSLNSWIAESVADGFQTGKINLKGTGDGKLSDALSINYNAPNYYTVKWSATTNPSFQMNFFQWSPNPNIMPSDSYTLSQEPDAPMISFDVAPAPTADQIKYFSADTKLAYFFGDARLRYMVNMVLVGAGLNFNSKQKFGFKNRELASYLYGSLILTNSQLLETSVNIGTQSWRTITMLFNIYVLPTDTNPKQYIFQYGTLSISAVKFGDSYQIQIDDSSKNISTKLSNTPLDINISYYLIIMQDQPEDNPYGPVTNIRICCVPLADIQSDSTVVFSINPATSYYKNNIESYWGAILGSKLIIGGYNATVVQSLNMNVGWLRVFDYVFTTDDIADDTNNRWQRNWFNMI